MFESWLAVPLHFTVEFLGFMVAAGGALLVLSRPNLVGPDLPSRVTAAAGFACLAAAQVVHGGSFVESDGGAQGAEILVGLRAMGLVLLALAVARGVRGEAMAATAVGRSIVPMAAGAAFLLALSALVVSFKRKVPALRRLVLAALLLGVSEVLLVSAEPGAQFGTSVVDGATYASHAFKLLGYLAMGAWLYTAARSSIRARFVAAFVSLLVIVVLVLSTALTGVISNNIEREELDRVSSQLANTIRGIQGEQTEDVLHTVQTIVGLPNLGKAVAARKGLSKVATDIDVREEDIFSLDFVVLMDPDGRLLAVSGAGPAVGAVGEDPRVTELKQIHIGYIIGSDVVADLTGPARFNSSAGPARLGNDAVAIIAAVQVFDPDVPSRRVGILAAGRYIDSFDIESISSSLRPARASLLVGDKVLATEIPEEPSADDIIPPEVAADLGTPGRPLSVQAAISGRPYFSAIGRLDAPGGVPVAKLVLSSPAGVVAQARAGVTRTLFLVAMGIGAIAFLLAYLSGRQITRPIQLLIATARRVREGDLHASTIVSGDDEVGQLGETFNEMTASLLRMTSELRAAAIEEQDLRSRMETIIQSMGEGLVAVGADKKVLAFNREAEQLTGISAGEAVGRPVRQVLNARDPEGKPVSLPIFRLAQGSVNGIFLKQASGDEVPVAIVSAILRDDSGKLAGAVALIRDITREREIELMKSEFLANISHELRTPLTPIKGYAELLGRKESLAPEKTKQFAEGILESTNRLERTVELLVDFAAMESGQTLPRPALVDLGQMVRSLAEEWSERSPRHSVEAEVRARLPKIMGDERLLRRSLEEVIDNAVKFSPEGGTVKLLARTVGSTNGNNAGRLVEVTVADEGIGIDPEEQESIFSDFHQSDGSQTRTYGGLGLGLSFVRRIVEAHSGAVRVESKPAGGTKLIISIPVPGKSSDPAAK